MIKPEIPFCFERLLSRLPLYDASRLAYVKSKFVWLVCDFSEEYFNNVNHSIRTKIIDYVFETIAINPRRYEINSVDKLLTCVANLYVRLMKKENAVLLVSNEFFRRQFDLNFRVRYKMFDEFIERNYNSLYEKLRVYGIEDAGNVLGVALDQIEEKMIHPVIEVNFISEWILNVVTICSYKGFAFSPAVFLGN